MLICPGLHSQHAAKGGWSTQTGNEHGRVLHQIYAPRTVKELCTPQASIDQIYFHARQSRYFAISYATGTGATATARLIFEELGYFVHTLSCSLGYAEVHRVLTNNLCHVLLAMQSNEKHICYFIKDFQVLQKMEKRAIMKLVEKDPTLRCVMFLHEKANCEWETVYLLEPTEYSRRVHLWWIVCEEYMDVCDEEMDRLAGFRDLRNAISSLRMPGVVERNYDDIEPYTKALYACETLTTPCLEHVVTFTELLSLSDLSGFRETREWFAKTTARFVDRHMKYREKQTHLARHAQICHRTMQLRRACKLVGIAPLDMELYSRLMQHHVGLIGSATDVFELPKSHSRDVMQAIYTITKMGSKAGRCHILKRNLGLTSE